MFNIKICIFFACTFANFNSIQMSTYEGFVPIGEGNYLIEANKKVNWFQAVYLCRARGAELINIESQEEMDAISEYLLAEGFKSEKFYTSLNDLGEEGNFYSIATGYPMTFADWSPEEPNNAGGNENCVQLWMTKRKYTMNDVPCNYENNYICKL